MTGRNVKQCGSAAEELVAAALERSPADRQHEGAVLGRPPCVERQVKPYAVGLGVAAGSSARAARNLSDIGHWGRELGCAVSASHEKCKSSDRIFCGSARLRAARSQAGLHVVLYLQEHDDARRYRLRAGRSRLRQDPLQGVRTPRAPPAPHPPPQRAATPSPNSP